MVLFFTVFLTQTSRNFTALLCSGNTKRNALVMCHCMSYRAVEEYANKPNSHHTQIRKKKKRSQTSTIQSSSPGKMKSLSAVSKTKTRQKRPFISEHCLFIVHFLNSVSQCVHRPTLGHGHSVRDLKEPGGPNAGGRSMDPTRAPKPQATSQSKKNKTPQQKHN